MRAGAEPWPQSQFKYILIFEQVNVSCDNCANQNVVIETNRACPAHFPWRASAPSCPYLRAPMAGALRDGDVLLFACLFACLLVACCLWNLLSHSLRGSTWRLAAAYRIDSDTLQAPLLSVMCLSVNTTFARRPYPIFDENGGGGWCYGPVIRNVNPPSPFHTHVDCWLQLWFVMLETNSYVFPES